jgi:glycerate kinase
MTKVLVIPDKFKGSVTSEQICSIAQTAAAGMALDLKTIPIADGGDGSIDVLIDMLDLLKISIHTYDPLMRKILAYYAIDQKSKVAYIEMAKTSGLSLLKESEKDVMKATSYGTGLMIADAMERGIDEIYLFLGGSATNDAALGCADALGFKMLDKHFDAVEVSGQNLMKVKHIRKSRKIPPKITIVSDVDNVMFGPEGAAYVFAKQKGANDKQVELLDEGLRNIGAIYDQLKPGTSKTRGSGAAGAFGAGAVALFDATIINGFDFIAQVLKIDQEIRKADVVITGEGGLDRQSFYGKVVGKILERVNYHHKEYYIVCGNMEDMDQIKERIEPSRVFAIVDRAESLDDAQNNADKHLENIFKEIYSIIVKAEVNLV